MDQRGPLHLLPEGPVWSDEVKALVFSIPNRCSVSFDQRDPDPVPETLRTSAQVTCEPSASSSPSRSHLFALVEPDLLHDDGSVDLGLGSLQFQDPLFLTV